MASGKLYGYVLEVRDDYVKICMSTGACVRIENKMGCWTKRAMDAIDHSIIYDAPLEWFVKKVKDEFEYRGCRRRGGVTLRRSTKNVVQYAEARADELLEGRSVVRHRHARSVGAFKDGMNGGENLVKPLIDFSELDRWERRKEVKVDIRQQCTAEFVDEFRDVRRCLNWVVSDGLCWQHKKHGVKQLPPSKLMNRK